MACEPAFARIRTVHLVLVNLVIAVVLLLVARWQVIYTIVSSEAVVFPAGLSQAGSCIPCNGPRQNASDYCGMHAPKWGGCTSTTHWHCELCRCALSDTRNRSGSNGSAVPICPAWAGGLVVRLSLKGGTAPPAAAPPRTVLEKAITKWPALRGVERLINQHGSDDLFGRLVGPTIVPLYQLFQPDTSSYLLAWNPAAVRRGNYVMQLVHLRDEWEAFDARACTGKSVPFLRAVEGANGAVLSLTVMSPPTGAAHPVVAIDTLFADQAGSGYYTLAHPPDGRENWSGLYTGRRSFYRLPWPTDLASAAEAFWFSSTPLMPATVVRGSTQLHAQLYPRGLVTCFFGDSQTRTIFVGFMRTIFGVPEATTIGETKVGAGQACTHVRAVDGIVCFTWVERGTWDASRLDECDAVFVNTGNHALAARVALDDHALALGQIISALPSGAQAPRVWWLETPPYPGMLDRSWNTNCRTNPKIAVGNLVARRLITALAPNVSVLPTFAVGFPLVDAAFDGHHIDAEVWRVQVSHTILTALRSTTVPLRGRTPVACLAAGKAHCRSVNASGGWISE